MGTAIRDASLTTARRRQLELYRWRLRNVSSVKKEQAPSAGSRGTGPSADVDTNVFVGAQVMGQSGACPCGPVSLVGYDKRSPASC